VSAYDRWLTTDPRQADADAYEAWCEAEGLDPADDHWTAFHEHVEALHEDALLKAAEDRRDWAEERAGDRYAGMGDW
jgi:hypothetical protein